jgi:hypothetical protein
MNRFERTLAVAVLLSFVMTATGRAGVPAAFIPNRGQMDPRVQFSSAARGAHFWFTREEAVFSLLKNGARADLRLHFIDAAETMSMKGADPLAGKINYFIGSDRSRWLADVPTYGELVYSGLWPGIDLVFRDQDGALKYEFHVAPGADVTKIQMQYRGAEGVARGSRGELVISTPLGAITDEPPVSYQIRNGKRADVATTYVVGDDGRYGFRLGAFDSREPLIIDPGLAYSTFVGGSGTESAGSIAVDAAGNAYVAGQTDSPDFPFSGGVGSTTGRSVFVTKLNPAGTALVYSTYLGGSAGEFAMDIAVDATGSVFVAGATGSADFPTTANAYDSTYNGGPAQGDPDFADGDAFLARLNPAGNGLLYSSYIGGTDWETPTGMGLDGSGNVYIAGVLASVDFPITAGAFQTAITSPFPHSFLTKITAAGTIGYSTYLNDFSATAMDADTAGNAYLAGGAHPSFPVTAGAFATTMKGNSDIAVAKMNGGGNELVYSTFLPGSIKVCPECIGFQEERDTPRALNVDSAGNAFVSGSVTAPDFPLTAGAYNTVRTGRANSFVTKINSTGSGLVYSTLLGRELVQDMAIDASGRVFLTGLASTGFVVTPGAFDATADGQDAFVTVLNNAGTALEYSTFLGGTDGPLPQGDIGFGIATDASNDVYVSGSTNSTTFPITTGAYDTAYNGGTLDGFVTKLDLDLMVNLESVSLRAVVSGNSFDIKGTFTLAASSDGIAPLTEEVRLTVGDSNYVIPAGSFKLDKKGRYKFESRALEMVITPLQSRTFELKVDGKGGVTGNISNIVLTIGNDQG